MRTLDLSDAAAFLGLHPNTLQARAKAGDIPGAKVGKEWRFLDVDLAEYLRANYADKQGEKDLCRSTKSGRRGTLTSSIQGSVFAEALGLPTVGKHSASTMNSKHRSGLQLITTWLI